MNSNRAWERNQEHVLFFYTSQIAFSSSALKLSCLHVNKPNAPGPSHHHSITSHPLSSRDRDTGGCWLRAVNSKKWNRTNLYHTGKAVSWEDKEKGRKRSPGPHGNRRRGPVSRDWRSTEASIALGKPWALCPNAQLWEKNPLGGARNSIIEYISCLSNTLFIKHVSSLI